MGIDITPDVRTWLLTVGDIAADCDDRVHHNYVPAGELPYVWYRLAGEDRDDSLDEEAGSNPLAYSFDIEVCGEDLDQVVSLANDIKNATPFRGTFGGITAKMVQVGSHNDDYVPQNEFAENVRQIQTLLLRVFP